MKTEPLTIRIDKKLKAEAKKAAKENARSLTKPDREIADRL
jgi:antitoxin component of RelBE/YafQ-DinJ toxin-antitoxin module